MIVKIAGYNIDKSLIDKLNLPQQATPETISAAYARISRSTMISFAISTPSSTLDGLSIADEYDRRLTLL